jgi:hypothetical protein
MKRLSIFAIILVVMVAALSAQDATLTSFYNDSSQKSKDAINA